MTSRPAASAVLNTNTETHALRGAKLINQDLSGANLTKANLVGAKLEGADLIYMARRSTTPSCSTPTCAGQT